MHQKILILDFGAQYSQLIARRVRENRVYCELHPYDVSEQFIRDFAPAGIILSGGPASVVVGDTPRTPQVVFDLGVPVLGICYGMQTMAAQLGGAVENGLVREFGYAEVRARGHSALLKDIQDRINGEGHGLLDVWMSHGDKVTALPAGFRVIGSNAATPIAAMADETRKFYGVQFHPEVTHTLQGKSILQRFVRDICGLKGDWNMPGFIDEAVARIRNQVGKEEVLLGLSGGVDSAVAAALSHRAIGAQLTCVFVDNGLLRLNEAEQVLQTLAKNLGVKVIHVDASQQFLGELAGVSDPEAKRKVIGRVFIEVFQREAAKLPQVKWLAQGTIYPDVIESAGAKTKKAHTIKSHHNVGGLPETLHLKLLEPLRELFKDEVRELGLALGLPHDMVFRHPFPGPGLGVRILGEVKAEYADILRRADAIFIDELRAAPYIPSPLAGQSERGDVKGDRTAPSSVPSPLMGQGKSGGANGDRTAPSSVPSPLTGEGEGGGVSSKRIPKNWYEATAQAFAVFLPVRSVGVMGDGRTYEYVIALRAVQTEDFMTAHWAELPHALLSKVSNRIINEVRGINRVVYDISGKPPATIEWE